LLLLEFAYNNNFLATIDMRPYKPLYGRKCRSPLYWDEVGERQLLGPEMVQDMKEKVALIQKQMLTDQSQQKSYADKHHCKLEFKVGDLVYLKVSPMRGVMRFGNKGKLSPRYIGPFQVLKCVVSLKCTCKCTNRLQYSVCKCEIESTGKWSKIGFLLN
jgi:hypothetical protein